MGVQRIQVLAPGTSLATSQTSEAADVTDAAQLIVECLPAELTGDLQVVLEFCCAPWPSAWGPELLDDVANGTPAGNDYTIPVRRIIRTWSENTPMLIPSPCGYAWCRVIVSSSNNAGNCGVFINKVTNRGG